MRFRDQLCKQGNSSKRIVIRLNSLDEQHSKAENDIFRSKMVFCAILTYTYASFYQLIFIYICLTENLN